MINLDMICAETGASMYDNEKTENAINKSLGILSADGLYALMLFLSGKKEKEFKKISEQLMKLCQHQITQAKYSKINNAVKLAMEISHNLHDLIFAKELCEQALVYGRYSAKAR